MKILYLLFIAILLITGCSISKTLNSVPSRQESFTNIVNNKESTPTPVQSYTDAINNTLLSEGVTVQWMGKIASRYSQIDGIKFCVIDGEHQKVDPHSDCDWFWLIPEDLGIENGPNLQDNWDGRWVKYMIERYSNINPDEIDWDNNIFLVTGKIESYDKDFFNRPIPNVIAIKIEGIK